MLCAVSDTKQRMVDTAVRLFRTQGYAATSWRGLVAEAGTPWGSVQHHFPGGKRELGLAAVAVGEDLVLGAIRIGFEKHSNPGEAIAWWFGKAQLRLERSDYAEGCPVMMLALHSGDPVVDAAGREALGRWVSALAEKLQAYDDPEGLALSVVMQLEGALLMSKALRSSRPLEVAAAEVRERFA